MQISTAKLTAVYNALFKTKLDEPGNIIYAVRSKEDFGQLAEKGTYITNSSYLYKNLHKFSHITPNLYRKPENLKPYSNIFGFTEDNIKIINSFVFDIDTKQSSVQEILLSCLDASIGAPTLVVETPRGYQVHFITAQPFYLSSKEGHASVYSAKQISKNLKESLVDIQADVFCNDFGFFRTPNMENLRWVDLTSTYTPDQLIQWSTRCDSDKTLSLQQTKTKNIKYMETATVQAILKLKEIYSENGSIGRNNTMFTLALACYADGISKEDAKALILKFNKQLRTPLKTNEIMASLRSAYSGRYTSPNFYYLKEILASNNITVINEPQMGHWYKHKKDRAQRKYSHKFEWENDIVAFLEQQELANTPYVEMPQLKLCEAIGCAQSTLNAVLTSSTKIIKVVLGKGRKAITKWTTHERIQQYINAKVQELKINKVQYRTFIKQIQIYFCLPKTLTINTPVAAKNLWENTS